MKVAVSLGRTFADFVGDAGVGSGAEEDGARFKVHLRDVCVE